MQESKITSPLNEKYNFKFIGDIYLPGCHDYDLYESVLDWCQTNTTGYYSVDTDKVYDQFFEVSINLHNEKDAMLFKLQFSEFV